jgi:hypothetical protein
MMIRCKSWHSMAMGLGVLMFGLGAPQWGTAADLVCGSEFISSWFENQTQDGYEPAHGFFGLFSPISANGLPTGECQPVNTWNKYDISLLTGSFDSQKSCAKAEILNGALSNQRTNGQFLGKTWSPDHTLSRTELLTELSAAAKECKTEFINTVCQNGQVDLSSPTTQSAIDNLYAPGAGKLLDDFCAGKSN